MPGSRFSTACHHPRGMNTSSPAVHLATRSPLLLLLLPPAAVLPMRLRLLRLLPLLLLLPLPPSLFLLPLLPPPPLPLSAASPKSISHSATHITVATSLPSTEACTPGGMASGGYINHSFEPVITAFHAEVPLGSLCHTLPLLGGPAMSHEWSGRESGSSSAKRSSK